MSKKSTAINFVIGPRSPLERSVHTEPGGASVAESQGRLWKGLGRKSHDLLLSDLGLDGVSWQHQLLDCSIHGTLWVKAVFLEEEKEE